MAKQTAFSKFPTAPAHQSEYHWKEYEILQGKIDKIGAFRFQIKNWVVVIVSTAAISGFYAKLPWWVFPFYLLVVGAFWAFEMKQKGFQDAYGNRAKYLEKVLRRNNKYVFSPKRRRKYSKIKKLMELEPLSLGEALHINEMHIKRNNCWSLLMKFSHHSFYVIVGLLVLAICLAAYMRPKESAQKVEFSTPLEVIENDNEGKGSKGIPAVTIKNEINVPRSNVHSAVPKSGAGAIGEREETSQGIADQSASEAGDELLSVEQQNELGDQSTVTPSTDDDEKHQPASDKTKEEAEPAKTDSEGSSMDEKEENSNHAK